MRAQRSSSTLAAVVGLAFLALTSTSSHTVRSGETLRGIAAAHNTTVAALAAANRLADPDLILVGQVLDLAGGGRTANAAATTTYRVRSGDTLGTIASRHGSTIAAIVQANRLTNPNLIRIGQELAIPASGGSAGGGQGVRPPAGGATTHVVQRGQTLSAIAARYRVTVGQVVAANGLTGDRIYVGQQLRLVPVAGSVPTTGGTYTVRAGDFLSSIARRFGTTVRALQDANGLRDADLVVVGKTLKIPAGGTGGGAIRCPVPGSRFMNDWGFPRSGGRFHEGNDVFAPRGTPALATVSGTVVQTTGVLGGNQVKLFGDDGVGYYYTHLDRFGEKGRVSAGSIIGYVGNTGNAAGGPTHVHFEVHPGGGAAVNPYPRLVAAC